VYWASVFTAAVAYHFALLPLFLFGNITNVMDHFFTMGFLNTFILWIVTLIPTFMSFHHIGTFVRDVTSLQGELWSKNAKRILPIGTVLLFFAGAVALYAIVLPQGFTFLVLGTGYVIGFALLSTFVKFLWNGGKTLFKRGSLDDHTNMFYDQAREFREVSADFHSETSPLLANGETFPDYLERVIHHLHRRYLLSNGERDSWLEALRTGEPKFVTPKSTIALRVLQSIFFARAQKKPMPDPWAMMQAMSNHVQGVDELVTYTAVSPRMEPLIGTRRRTLRQRDQEQVVRPQGDYRRRCALLRSDADHAACQRARRDHLDDRRLAQRNASVRVRRDGFA
jgi:hypothetical protein